MDMSPNVISNAAITPPDLTLVPTPTTEPPLVGGTPPRAVSAKLYLLSTVTDLRSQSMPASKEDIVIIGENLRDISTNISEVNSSIGALLQRFNSSGRTGPSQPREYDAGFDGDLEEDYAQVTPKPRQTLPPKRRSQFKLFPDSWPNKAEILDSKNLLTAIEITIRP